MNHGHINVNGRRVNIPSYRLRKGDEITLRIGEVGPIAARTKWVEKRTVGVEFDQPLFVIR